MPTEKVKLDKDTSTNAMPTEKVKLDKYTSTNAIPTEKIKLTSTPVLMQYLQRK